MLGDLFPRRRLAMATGVYYAGIPLGTAVSLMASSYLAPRYGWRTCFFVLGGVGLVAVLLLLLFREPQRRETVASTQHASFGKLAADLVRSLRTRRELALTLAGGSLLTYGAAAALHTVTWLVEERGLPYAEAAFTAGFIGVFAGFLGNLAGGAFGDWCARRRPNGHLWSLIPISLCFAASGLLFYLLPARSPLFYLFWFLTAACTSGWFGPLFATIQEQAPASARASTVALALLVLNLLGVGPGPLVTGMIGDARGLTAGLLSSLALVAAAVVPFALASRAKHPVQRDGA
jgi:predicted MFS family arabinose efflux permease